MALETDISWRRTEGRPTIRQFEEVLVDREAHDRAV